MTFSSIFLSTCYQISSRDLCLTHRRSQLRQDHPVIFLIIFNLLLLSLEKTCLHFTGLYWSGFDCKLIHQYTASSYFHVYFFVEDSASLANMNKTLLEELSTAKEEMNAANLRLVEQMNIRDEAKSDSEKAKLCRL